MGEGEFERDEDGTRAPDLKPDLRTVDALARLQLVARRHGCRIVVVQPDPVLVELIELAGLGEILEIEP
jgi:anti-anti-sigma regulatory factor